MNSFKKELYKFVLKIDTANKMKWTIGIYLILLLLYSCEWQPTGVYEVEIDKNVDPPQIVELTLNFEDDSVILYGSGSPWNITYDFKNLNKHKIYSVSFFLNESLLKTSENAIGAITLYNSDLPIGNNKLSVKITTSSTTGSIADIIGAEGFILEKEWPIKRREQFSYPLTITNVDGYLNISWPECKLFDFGGYRITLSGDNTVTTLNTQIIDYDYVGLEQGYTVEIITKKGHTYPWGSIRIYKDLPKISFSNEGELKVFWNKVKYTRGVEKWVLYSPIYGDSKILKETIDPNDTIYFIPDYVLGGSYSFQLKVVPKNKQILTWQLADYLDINQLGMKTPDFKYFFAISPDKYLIIKKFWPESNTIFSYSTTHRDLVEQVTHLPTSCDHLSSATLEAISVSPGGKYITAKLNCNSILLGASHNLNEYALKDYPKYSNSNFFSAPVSDKGTAIVQNLNEAGFVVYDLINNLEICKVNTQTYYNTNSSSMSSNGNYFTFFGLSNNFLIPNSFILCHNSGSIIDTVVTLNWPDVKFFRFSSTDPDLLAFLHKDVFSIRNCEDFSAISELDLSLGIFLDIDFYKEQILIRKNNYLQVLDMYSGEIVYETQFSTSYNDFAFRLLDNTIFHPSGFGKPFSPTKSNK